MKYKIAQTKDYIAPSKKYLIHSIKETPENTVESREPSGWDKKLFSNFESNLRGANGKLDPKSVQQMLLFGKDENGKGYDNFKVALNKAGIDTSKIDDNSLNLMRYKVVEHYKNEFTKEKDNFDEEGNRIKDREESSTKSDTKSNSKSSKKSKNKTSKSKSTESKTNISETNTKKNVEESL